jgi:hypothetical protein
MTNPVLIPDETLSEVADTLDLIATQYEWDDLQEDALRIRRLIKTLDGCRKESRERRRRLREESAK